MVLVFSNINDKFTKEQIEMLSPLVLAFIGDTVYDLFVRTMLVSESTAGVNKLHKDATSFVKCSAQSDSYLRIEPYLTEQEISIFKRGRNAKSHVPKNANLRDYKNATGIEALIGYIYLIGDTNRLNEIMNMIWCGS